ncbi:MAG: PHP domain-containing protein [Promethearchaeota archaeon]|nr:MAG: PHP domain-containing protein [Candidatus Lokiarchaeota archaeon]
MLDLHLHSTKSDGLDSPTELVNKAAELGIKAIAITDHDTIDGVEEFLSAGEKKKIITIPGIEISIRHEPEREIKDVHIVGLNIDHHSPPLIKALKLQLEGRLQQKRAICKRLREEFNYEITYEEVKNIASSSSVGRPHIVEIMIKNNPDKVKNKTKNELFKMISLGGKAYVDREFEVNLEESIELIKKASGIPVLAHPGVYEVSDRVKFVKLCVNAGIEGIEIEYPYSKNRPFYGTKKANWAQKTLPELYRNLAIEYHLIKSGGSDYHGGKKGLKIGEVEVPDKYLIDILSN